jgi:pimeloyl-ACP methyl ester carboxylesterase
MVCSTFDKNIDGLTSNTLNDVIWVNSVGNPARPPVGNPYLVTDDLGNIINYFIKGEGETVILIASLGRSVSDFNELVNALVFNGYRTVAIEARGIGGSNPILRNPTLHDFSNDVKLVVDSLGDINESTVNVVGHAFGNRVARAFASDYPELVKRIILLAAGGLVEPDTEILKSLTICFLTWLPDFIREKHIRAAFFSSCSIIPSYWYSGWYFQTFLSQSKSTQNTDLEDWWGGGTAPMLILQGEDDTAAPIENVYDLKKKYPDRVSLVLVNAAGHAMLPEKPEIINKKIINFFKSQ